uniref:Uncharacterized protein n=1 Tax=Populus trichocarpa TaxID=3694 RepID=A0A2K1WZL2_POPTR
MHVRSGSGCLLSDPPVPSQELSQGILVKTWVFWLLEGRAQLEGLRAGANWICMA